MLVIGAWNLPFAVSLAPAVAAIAAGNAVVVKPSELAPASAFVMRELVNRYCDPRVIQVIEGDADVTQALLRERWDHIFFTGSAPIGRKIAEAAAPKLTPVSLELGGKCPAYVHASADLEVAARRIAWGKFMNAGQVCIAPDYVMVDRTVQQEFTQKLVAAVHRFYGAEPERSADFAKIVNARHFDRVAELIDGAGGRTVLAGKRDSDTNAIGPVIIADPDLSSDLMNEEIFGPVLPVVGVDGVDDALNIIAERSAPLAAYPFAKDAAPLAAFEEKCRTGAVVSNDVTVNHAVRSLPFGGVGESGYGVYHGVHGFRTFSHAKAVLRRGTGSDPDLRYPPYTDSKIKWLKRLG